MKVIFISSSSLGPRYIMGLLKKAGHQAMGIYQGIDDYLGEPASGFDSPIPMKSLIKEEPDVIGFSVDCSSYRTSVKMAEKIKNIRPNIFVIFGGVHPTIFPDETISHTCIDAVCMGEGEYPMLDLCNAMQAGQTIIHIQNLWIKDKGRAIYKNPMRPYVQNLDDLEMDREGLYYFGIFSGRGCVGNCSFCNTPVIKRAGGKGKYLRKRSVDKVLDEIESMLRLNRRFMIKKYVANPTNIRWLYNLASSLWKPSIRFKDDTFLADKTWFLEFAKKFSRRFPRIGYLCNARADEIDEEVGEWLRKSHCQRVGIGFECGNEEYRNKILKKRVSNEDISKCVEILKHNQISILGQWIVGLPGETVHNVIESLELSIRIGDIPQVHIAQPYPKTEMHKQAVEMGLVDENYIPECGVYTDFVLHKGETQEIMKILYNLFSLKDLIVPKNYEPIKHLGGLRTFAEKKLGRILTEELNWLRK